MNLSKISAIVTSFNEAANITRCLDGLEGFGEIILVDSFSADDTLELARKYPVTIYQRAYESAARQKNWALDRARYPWVLILDADEALTEPLKREIAELDETSSADGFWIRRQSDYLGHTIKHCGWQRDKVLRLFRQDLGRYEEKAVHEEVTLNGRTAMMRDKLQHFPYPNVEAHFRKIREYSSRGAIDYVANGGRLAPVNMLLHPPFRFLRMYLLQLGILDGPKGFVLCLLSSYGVYLKYAKAWKRQRSRRKSAELRKVCFFGGYTEGYPRNEVLRKGLLKRGVEVCTCRTSPRRRLFTRYAALLYRYLKMKRDFEVIYVPEFRHKDVPLAYVLARLSGKRVIFDPLVSRLDTKINRGDATEGSFQAWHNRNLDRMSLSMCDLVLSDTQAHADYYVNELHATREKIRVLPIGFDEDLFSPNSITRDRREGTCRVLFVGSYLPLHGVDVIVRAAKLLASEDIEFILIGGGQTFRSVAQFVKEHKLSRVQLRGNVPMEQLAAHLTDADISLGVFGPTAKTTRVVANKVFQSMAVGRPVITADTSAAREFFSEGENICLVPAGDAEALAERIRELAREPARQQRIGASGAKLVHERFSSPSIADLFLRYTGELLGQSTSSMETR